MLYLKDEKEVRFFEIIRIEKTEVERILKNILGEYNNMVSRGAYDIENY